jgi:hypothetical protein
VKDYVGYIWIGDEPGLRLTVQARTADEARSLVEVEYGEGHTISLWNEEDAQRPRFDPDLVSRAVVVWTGHGDPAVSSPSRDERRLVDHFGPDAAVELLPVVRQLEGDFYKSDARHTASDLSTMADLASRDFVRLHPELPAEASVALAWCYTFDHK